MGTLHVCLALCNTLGASLGQCIPVAGNEQRRFQTEFLGAAPRSRQAASCLTAGLLPYPPYALIP